MFSPNKQEHRRRPNPVRPKLVKLDYRQRMGSPTNDEKESQTRFWFQRLLFSSLPAKMIQFDEHIFQMGWIWVETTN